MTLESPVHTQLKAKSKAVAEWPSWITPAQPYFEAMARAQERQQTPEFKKEYKAKAGIEGTISQAVRAGKMRKARYRGLIKTRLQHYATAAGINLLRLGAWWSGRPREKTQQAPFLSVAPEPA